MTSVKLSPRTGADVFSRTSDARRPSSSGGTPDAPSEPVQRAGGKLEPGRERGNAARAAAVNDAQATIGTARLNRLLNPPAGKGRLPSSAHSSETLPIGAVEASRAPSGGRPLENDVRTIAEREVGADLGAVRVHTDEHANAAAESLSARAFTSGNDIFLGPGESPTDTELIAHEAAQALPDQSNPTGQP